MGSHVLTLSRFSRSRSRVLTFSRGNFTFGHFVKEAHKIIEIMGLTGIDRKVDCVSKHAGEW